MLHFLVFFALTHSTITTLKTTSTPTVPTAPSRVTTRAGTAGSTPTPSGSAGGSLATSKGLPDVFDPQVLCHLVGDKTAIKDIKHSAAAFRGAASKAFVAANNGINADKTARSVPSILTQKPSRLSQEALRPRRRGLRLRDIGGGGGYQAGRAR